MKALLDPAVQPFGPSVRPMDNEAFPEPEIPGMTPDRALVEAVVRDGDEQAFRELYRRHTPRLYPLVLRLLGGSEVDAEDVVQEAWIRASSGMRRFRGDSSFGTWLTAIGLNAARDHLRRRGRWGITEDMDQVEIAVPPAPPMSRGSRTKRSPASWGSRSGRRRASCSPRVGPREPCWPGPRR